MKSTAKTEAPATDESALEKQVSALIKAWNKAGPDARCEFMSRVETPIMDVA